MVRNPVWQSLNRELGGIEYVVTQIIKQSTLRDGRRFLLVVNDLLWEPVDAIVNAANSLLRAHERGWRSLSFPAISSGILAVPHEVCARAYVAGVRRRLPYRGFSHVVRAQGRADRRNPCS